MINKIKLRNRSKLWINIITNCELDEKMFKYNSCPHI